MDETTTLEPRADEQAVTTAEAPVAGAADEAVEEELLIEEVSIDGMCGVY